MGQRLALIVGNYIYDDESLARLQAPGTDVESLIKILENPEVGGFNKVIPLINETSPVVQREIAFFFKKKKRDDLLLLYFSGHGVLDEDGRLYLAVRDTLRELPTVTGISSELIARIMDRSFSLRQVLVLDCCHSGAFARGAKGSPGATVGTAEAFRGNGYGRVVLTATDATQYAWERDKVRGQAQQSVFTHYLIHGLESGEADKDQDGLITLSELYKYVYEKIVTENYSQTPHIWTYEQEGEIVISKNPRWEIAGPPDERTEKIIQLLEKAERCLAKKQLEQAVNLYREVLDIDSQNVRAQKGYRDAQKALEIYYELTKGKSHLKNGEYQKASASFRKVLEIDPANIEAIDKLAETERREKEAKQIAGLLSEALTFYKKGRLQKSQDVLKQVLNIDPRHSEAQRLLQEIGNRIQQAETTQELLEEAKHYEKSRQTSPAAAKYREILQLDPHNKEARRGLKRVTARRLLKLPPVWQIATGTATVSIFILSIWWIGERMPNRPVAQTPGVSNDLKSEEKPAENSKEVPLAEERRPEISPEEIPGNEPESDVPQTKDLSQPANVPSEAQIARERLATRARQSQQESGSAQQSAQNGEADQYAPESYAAAERARQQGENHLAAGKPADAILAFKKAAEGFAKALRETNAIQRGRERLQQGEYERGIQLLKSVFPGLPDRVDNQQAREVYQKLHAAKTIFDERIEQAREYARRNQFSRALGVLDSIPDREAAIREEIRREILAGDTQPPQIAHTPPREYDPSHPLTLRAQVTDSSLIRQVKLHVRKAGDSQFQSYPMELQNPNTYAITVSPANHSGEDLHYYFEAEDLSKNTAVRDEKAPYEVVAVRDRKPPIIKHDSKQYYRQQKPLALEISVQDDSPLDRVLLHYRRHKLDSDFTTKMMTPAPDEKFKIELPKDLHRGRKIYYFFSGQDKYGNKQTLGSANNPFEIDVKPPPPPPPPP